jgi:hypothetical protein
MPNMQESVIIEVIIDIRNQHVENDPPRELAAESSIRHDHSEKAYRRYQMREALTPSQKRHNRGKNQQRQSDECDATRGWKQQSRRARESDPLA